MRRSPEQVRRAPRAAYPLSRHPATPPATYTPPHDARAPHRLQHGVSRKHRHVGRSSSHNEYMALASGAQELKWVRDLLKEMGFADCVRAPSPILGDNDQATRWSIERMVTTGNKCIRTDYHWIKECVQLGDICPRRVSTENNISDLFTKSLSGQNFTRLREILIGRSAIPALPPPPHR